jgi:hypothetical protein
MSDKKRYTVDIAPLGDPELYSPRQWILAALVARAFGIEELVLCEKPEM